MTYLLTDAENPKKRFMIITPDNKAIQFGSPEHENYTIHKDDDRKNAYLKRHSPRENWTETGIDTPGFWSVHLLWSKPTIDESIKAIEKRFGIKIVKGFLKSEFK